MKQLNKLVTVVITSDTISSVVIDTDKKHRLHASFYATHSLKNAIIQGVPMQSTVLANFLCDYATRYKLTGMNYALCLANGAIQEQFTRMPTTLADGTCVHKGKRRYGYQYIAPDDNGHFIFCSASIPSHILCAYQLIFMRLGVELSMISGPTSTSLAVYKHLYGDAYRQTELAANLQSCNYHIEQLITDHMVDRLLARGADIQLNKRALLYALGLAISHKENA